MADGAHNDDCADGQGIYDSFLVPDGFDDDVLYLLDMNGGMDPPPPPPPLQAAPAEQSAIAAGASGDNNLLEWPPPTLDYINNSVDNNAPTHNALLADDPTSGAQDVGTAAGTSATAPRSSSPSSSSAVHQNASLDCTGCQVLREVVHCNGLEATKFSIHGIAAGVFHHATLEVYRIDSNGLAATMTTQMTHQSYVDFRGRDYVWVKHYLMDYAQQRAGGGYVVLQDSISAFQDALCTRMIVCGGHADDDHREAVAPEINGGHAGDHREAVALETNGGHQRVVACPADDGAVQRAMVEQGNDVPAEAPAAGPSKPVAKEQGRRSSEIRPAAKTAVAIQRERASNLQLDDIARYFHLPMVEAAKELRICATVLKGTSRKFHIRRWPYRKVRSIDSQIAKLRRGNGDPAAQREIERLTDYRRRIYAGLE
ncbi:uncharacterized protein [Miscanthus floridulus]|uniref:uncharacterized protein n=1 Tax=Miscanthus floridulus TaxID=154761 RepID=UPI0034591D02